MTSTVGRRQVNTFYPSAQVPINYGSRMSRRASDKSSNRGNVMLAKFIIIAVVAVFVLIGLQAYTATLQHANNILVQDNQYLQAEIDSIKSQIVEETKVTRIEKIATNKYGMVYPTSDNCISICEGKENGKNLAAAIKSEAYN
ncbi:MAG TPA: hypothetical protein GX736_04330 [Mogibacterium sp.]|nr:hypothetical protein [Mogibacterium sp.]